MTVPPSDKYREELNKVDGKSFAAGNLTSAGKSKTAFQKIALKARNEAHSVDQLPKNTSMLKKELAKIDEREAIKSGKTFGSEFEYIHATLSLRMK